MNISGFRKLPIVLWLQTFFTPLRLAFASRKPHTFLVQICRNLAAGSCTAENICSLKMKNILKVKLLMLTNLFP